MGTAQGCCQTTVMTERGSVDNMQPSHRDEITEKLEDMNILEFEDRVKKFAHPDN